MLIAVAAGTAILAEEGHEPEPEHVERCQQCSENADGPVGAAAIGAGKRLPQNFVLAEEAAEERYAGDGEGGRGHGPEGPGNFLAQTAHVAHVLLAAERMNDRAGCEEEQA